MSKRPSFQFYPADWSANPNLKRCSFAEKGIWLEVMCLLHDQPEYGVLRWTLQEIATAVKCRPADLRSLQRKGVLKGDDETLADPFIYTPRSGRKDGPPVTLVPVQAGPIWFSSRMVKDEYVRGLRAEGGGSNETQKAPPEGSPNTAPKGGIGEAFGPRGSSSSSSASALKGSEDKSSGGLAAVDDLDGTAWATARTVLVDQGGMSREDAGKFFGKLLATHRLEARDMLSSLAQAVVSRTEDPRSYLTKGAQAIAKRRTPTNVQPLRQGFV